MPLVFCKNIINDCWLALWEIAESHEYFLERLPLDENTSEELEDISHPQKQLEWLASRYCLEYLAKSLHIQHNGMAKDEFGKPFLEDCQAEMSLTHTERFVAVAIHSSKSIGLDMEKPSEKLQKISSKFLAQPELLHANNDFLKLCLYWAGKEALYKLYGRKRLFFKENLRINPFDNTAEQLHGYIVIDNTTQAFTLYVVWHEGFALVLAV